MNHANYQRNGSCQVSVFETRQATLHRAEVQNMNQVREKKQEAEAQKKKKDPMEFSR